MTADVEKPALTTTYDTTMLALALAYAEAKIKDGHQIAITQDDEGFHVSHPVRA